MQILSLFPGLLLFPVLFYGLTQAIFNMPGVKFGIIAGLMALSVLTLIPALSFGLKKLVPDEELRFEVHFVVTLFVTILGLITTVNGHVTYAAVKQPTDWKAITTATVAFVFAFLLGYGCNRLKWWIIKKVINK